MKKLRGHHLFCMSLFTGHGYDQAFTENMHQLLSALKGGDAFQLCLEQDQVCEACPHKMADGGCVLGTEDVFRRDREALEVLGLVEGEKMTWPLLVERVGTVDEAGFQKVCGNCRWAKEGLCSYQLLRQYNAQAAAKL